MTRWETRAEWGALPPKSPPSTVVNPEGVKLHYGGAGPFKRDTHAGCQEVLRGWQRMHQADRANNYTDLAYNLAVCHHDVVMEGRSTAAKPVARSGANGNSTLNYGAYAVVSIWGERDGNPPDSLLRAYGTAVRFLREKAGAGTFVLGHRDGWATECPGDAIYAQRGAVARYASQTTTEDDELTPEQYEKLVSDIAKAVWDRIVGKDLSGTDRSAAWMLTGARNNAFQAAKGAPTQPEPEPEPEPTPCDGHTVVKGDTLGKIATDNGITLADLLALNPQITDPNRIEVGDCITLPAPKG